MTSAADLSRLRNNLQGEVDGAALYRAMAAHEPNAQLAEVYRQLAGLEDRHAEFWRAKLGAAGAPEAALRPGWRTRALVATFLLSMGPCPVATADTPAVTSQTASLRGITPALVL